MRKRIHTSKMHLKSAALVVRGVYTIPLRIFLQIKIVTEMQRSSFIGIKAYRPIILKPGMKFLSLKRWYLKAWDGQLLKKKD